MEISLSNSGALSGSYEQGLLKLRVAVNNRNRRQVHVLANQITEMESLPSIHSNTKAARHSHPL